jgi:hypothetical protein
MSSSHVDQMVGHCFQATRSVDLQRVRSSEDPGREDQIGVARRVIGMKVGDKRDLQILRPDRRDAFRRGCGGAAHDPRSEIDEIGAVVDDNRGRRPRPFGVSSWGTSSEQDNLRPAGSGADRCNTGYADCNHCQYSRHSSSGPLCVVRLAG